MLGLGICFTLMLLIAAIFFLYRPFYKIQLVAIILLPILSFSLYWHWGHSQAWLDYQKISHSTDELPNPLMVIQQLQQHLAQQPNSAEGWYLLGRLYRSQQQFSAAAAAFDKANQLQPQQINTLLNYAEVLFMENKTQNLPQIQYLLKEALKLEPHNDAALNLLAITYYQQHAYNQAIQLWEQLSEKYSPDSADGQALLKAIAEAQKMLLKRYNNT